MTQKKVEIQMTVATPKEEAPKVAKPKKAKKEVDKGVYDKYTGLKFISFTETKLSENFKKQLAELEKELLTCDGEKPIRTQRAAIDNEQVLIVEGIPLPKEYAVIIKNSSNPKYYLGK